MEFTRKKMIALGALFLLAIFLTACGGGGGGGATTTGSTTCTWDSSAWDNCKLE